MQLFENGEYLKAPIKVKTADIVDTFTKIKWIEINV